MTKYAGKIMSFLSKNRYKIGLVYSLSYKSHLMIAFILIMIASSYCIPYIFPLDPYSASEYLLYPPGFISPGGNHFFLGTDDLGRDVLSRLVFGARSTLGVGFFVVILSMIIGSILGFLSSVYGGFIDFFIQYINDIIMSFPNILFTVLLLTIFGPGIKTSVMAVTIGTIPGFVRVVKAVATDEMKKDYITVARSFGLSRFKILTSELLPNCYPAIVVQAVFAFSDAILLISVLGFLRIGVSPPMAEWGSMLADAYQFMESDPSLVILPGLCIFFTVFAANLLGDQLLDKRRTL